MDDMPRTKYFAGSIAALRLTEVRIPNHTVRGSSARMECHYEMDGEALYSVKWYKDGNEFYRYVPRDMPPVQFPPTCVSVDLHNSTDSLVMLQSVNLSASGRYRCEVSAEGPSFQTVSDHGDMIVVVPTPRLNLHPKPATLPEWGFK
uniref:Ig-like domain-containing protein n=1 Tax=Lutzomyia longipalpis TaxID=7200 RepID=A0A1B0CVS5_LUTLO